jgi:hypothetical protein
MAHWVLLVLARLDEFREFVECHPPAGFVVGWRDPGQQVVVDGEHVGAADRISERERDYISPSIAASAVSTPSLRPPAHLVRV